MQGFDKIPPVVSEMKIKDGWRRPHLSTDRTIFGRTQLDSWGNISDKFRKIPTSSLGGDAIMRKKLRTDGWTADGILKILPQNLIPDVPE